MMNKNCMGGFLLILAMSFVLATKDNPWIESHLEAVKKERNQRITDFLKHISVVGAAFILIGDGGK